MSKYNYSIGIDEAGRGPIAGPVSVGVVKIFNNSSPLKFFDELLCDDGRCFLDSKQLSVEKRNMIYDHMVTYKKDGDMEFYVTSVNPSIIDEKGISYALSNAIARLLRKFDDIENAPVFLDGRLHAPDKYTKQQTVTKGDTLHLSIALASIAAKVTRDKYMMKQDKMFPKYGFKKHKGYGTIDHRKAIKKYGLCPLHRKSFCKRFK